MSSSIRKSCTPAACSRLVGDIGEILVAASYEIDLFEVMRRHHDGRTTDGRLVQIKTTMKESLTFPAHNIPEYYLGIKVSKDGSFEEVFNGPRRIAWEAVKERKSPRANLHSISIRALMKLSSTVSVEDRIPLRTRSPIRPAD
jgi:hypothetical protein